MIKTIFAREIPTITKDVQFRKTNFISKKKVQKTIEIVLTIEDQLVKILDLPIKVMIVEFQFKKFRLMTSQKSGKSVKTATEMLAITIDNKITIEIREMGIRTNIKTHDINREVHLWIKITLDIKEVLGHDPHLYKIKINALKFLIKVINREIISDHTNLNRTYLKGESSLEKTFSVLSSAQITKEDMMSTKKEMKDILTSGVHQENSK